jgi:uncharacterized SAM-binding protein YcdF (DUF218 family)
LVAEDVAMQKFIARLLMPAGLLWMLLITATVAFARRLQWQAAGVCLLVTLFYTLAGNSWVGALLLQALENQVQPLDVNALEPMDAVCVLGGGTQTAPDGTAQLSSAGDRLALAARVYFADKTKTLVCSGSSIPGIDRPRDLAEETAQIWKSWSIPDSAIVRHSGPTITAQEIAALRELGDRHGWKRIGLVTSAWHMPRARRRAFKEGMTIVELPCDWRGVMPPSTWYWLIPNSDGFSRVQTACAEVLASVVGR